FHNPNRFNLEYIGEDGKPHQPVMLHRALLGSLERFFGILVEHYAGAFPLWLAPVQARVLTITSDVDTFAQETVAKLQAAGFRVEADLGSDKINAKVRDAQMAKIPYSLVIGRKEAEAGQVSVRRYGQQDSAVVS